MKNNLVIVLLVVILVGAGAFYAGMKYQQSKSPSFGGQMGNNFGNGQFNRDNGQGQRNGGNFPGGANRNSFRPVNGEIISFDDKSITVKLTDGSSKIVLLSDKTEINKAEKGAVSDLKTGVNVAVFGTENSDGSVTAQNIQLNPEFRNRLEQTAVTPTP